jgi:hypothetical protein
MINEETSNWNLSRDFTRNLRIQFIDTTSGLTNNQQSLAEIQKVQTYRFTYPPGDYLHIFVYPQLGIQLLLSPIMSEHPIINSYPCIILLPIP